MRSTINIEDCKQQKGPALTQRNHTQICKMFRSFGIKITVCNVFCITTLGMITNRPITDDGKVQKKFFLDS